MRVQSVVLSLLALWMAAALPGAPKEKDPAFAEMEGRVGQYVALKKSAARKLPKVRKDSPPEEIAAHKRSFRERVVAARAGAKAGDILSPSMFDLVSAVRSATAGAQGQGNRDAILSDGNPVEEGLPFDPRVNAVYPPDAPRSTVPPDVLARLPALPEGLEFRFVGRTLILYDSDIDLIVDYVAGAVEGSETR